MDYNAMLQLPEAKHKQRQSVTNWFLHNRPLVRSESACFLDMLSAKDYIAIGAVDRDKVGFEALLELAVQTFPGIARRLSISQAKTGDSHVFVFPPRLLAAIVKGFTAIVFPLWLILPALLLSSVASFTLRAVIYSVFIFWTSFVVITTTNSTKYDLILALVT
ncbi:Fc.00g058030.m01.CDS01 [Cosmosporella sp. VM-42]